MISMKYIREIKVGALALLCLFLLFFGFNFLKGVNIFTPTNMYAGYFDNTQGLENQSPVYIKGFKVGHVNEIVYDFTKDTAFRITISIHKDIRIPDGSKMALVADGLLGGRAIELQLAKNNHYVESGTTLNTICIPGALDVLQSQLLPKIDTTIYHIDEMIIQLTNQIDDNNIKNALANIQTISSDLTTVSKEMKYIVKNDIPNIVQNVDTTIANLNVITTAIKEADVQNTMAKLDTAVTNVNTIIADVKAQDGTVGKLLYDTTLYKHLNATIISADSLLVDIKKNPKRYINISVFGKKEK